MIVTLRWSWIFTLFSLLVRLGSATLPKNDDILVNDLHKRAELVVDSNYYMVSTTPMSTKNVGIIVGCVVAGIAVSSAVLGWCFVSRKRRLRVPHAEEGVDSPVSKDDASAAWKPSLKSQFSPDETKSSGFDRIRAAFGRRKKSEDSILPVYRVQMPPGSSESIEPPPRAAQGHVPRYPNILERGNSQRGFSGRNTPPKRSPPSPLKGFSDISRTPSASSSIRSAGGPRTPSRPSKRLQMPPKAVIVPPPGRPLPGLPGAKTSVPQKSPSKRRSWLSKHAFKHPFIPFRSPDVSLKFPPGSPLGQYQPSRQQLEARFDMVTPRVSSPLAETPRRVPNSAKEFQRRDHVVKRQPVPRLEEDSASARQAKIVEALQSAEIEGRMTPTGYRTAIPPTSSKAPQTPRRVDSPVPPTTAYI